MRLLMGYILGAFSVFAVLAIWQHRAIPDLDPDDLDSIVFDGVRPAGVGEGEKF